MLSDTVSVFASMPGGRQGGSSTAPAARRGRTRGPRAMAQAATAAFGRLRRHRRCRIGGGIVCSSLLFLSSAAMILGVMGGCLFCCMLVVLSVGTAIVSAPLSPPPR